MKKPVDPAATRAAVMAIKDWIAVPAEHDKPGRALLADAVRRTVGLCEQQPMLFDEDIRQNLLFARDTATDAELEAVSKARIDTFSELLMDYISAGHFEIYPQLAEEAKAFNDESALHIAARLLERLEMSTAMVLEFDEDFASPVRCQQNLARLPAWIDRLAKGLTERFALEDQLIARLHAAHSPQQIKSPA